MHMLAAVGARAAVRNGKSDQPWSVPRVRLGALKVRNFFVFQCCGAR